MLPSNVTGELDLTQSLTGGLDNGTAATRGYTTSAPGMPYFSNASQVSLALDWMISTVEIRALRKLITSTFSCSQA